jgi:hypothetical protein
MSKRVERFMRAAPPRRSGVVACLASARLRSLYAGSGRAWLARSLISDQLVPKPTREEAARRLIAEALARQ